MKLPLSRRASLTLIAGGVAVAAGAVIAPVGASAAVSYVVLAHNNYATWQTNISNSAGTPLGLTAKSGYPPLWVNNSKVVARLNADYVDGLHASSFARVTGKTGVIVVPGDSAICPKGTILTGGGGLPNASLTYSGPAPIFDSIGTVTGFNTNGWLALSSDGADSYSFAVCYNPKGAVPGALSSAALASLAGKDASPLAKFAAKHGASPTPTVAATPTVAPSPLPSSSAAVAPPAAR